MEFCTRLFIREGRGREKSEKEGGRSETDEKGEEWMDWMRAGEEKRRKGKEVNYEVEIECKKGKRGERKKRE